MNMSLRWYGPGSVSYTHLDVYKRQTLDWSGMTSSALFVGLDNFKELLQDKYFFNAVANSFKYMLMAVPLQLVISLALAYIFNSILKKGATFFRTVFFLPVITTASIVGIIMMFIFGGTGSINQFLSLFGVRGLNWLGNANTALIVVVLIGVWKLSLIHIFSISCPHQGQGSDFISMAPPYR